MKMSFNAFYTKEWMNFTYEFLFYFSEKLFDYL